MSSTQKNEILESFKEVAKIAIDASNIILDNSQKSLHEYMASISEKIDSWVENTEKVKSITFFSGEVGIEFVNDEEFKFIGEFYFQTANQEWIREEVSGRPSSYKYHFNKESECRIKEEKIIKFEYEKPRK